MIYVYRRAASDGARELVEEILLQGVRARRSQGRAMQDNIATGDTVVCWGDQLPALRVPLNDLKVLNNVAPMSKFTEAQTLAAAGVPTVQVSRTRPAPTRRAPFAEQPYIITNGLSLNAADARALAQRLTQHAAEQDRLREAHARQPQITEEWLARRDNHVGGSDLLRGGTTGDYYSKKENIIEEYRLHMFAGKSIRAGVKRQAATRPDGSAPHAWIRSFDAGWKIHYDGFRSTEEMRTLAARAVEALGLQFGAVDLARTSDGRLIVLEVNRAPGVEGGTAVAYATKIVAFANGTLDQPRATRRRT